MGIRRLLVVLGDQLDAASALFADADPRRDCIWMAEVEEEATHVWSHKARIALFLSAMRHFREDLRGRGWRVEYSEGEFASLAAALQGAMERLRPESVHVVEPGDWRVRESLLAVCPDLRIVEDRHFLCTRAEFERHARGRKQLRMEYFYREMRVRHGVLLDDGEPCGGSWNYDAENREAFDARGPGLLPAPESFAPDALTQEVLDMVSRRFAGHPGRLDRFDWPVTAEQAREALRDFLDQRLERFGAYQDAMWTAEPYLYHSRLAAALNLKLLSPLEVIREAEVRYREGRAGLAAVEGFIRQILGWREYVRGLYWMHMPRYVSANALDAHQPLPRFYWTGETEMRCLKETIGQTLEYGYAHHIQRLMVTGLFALLLGVEPRQVHEWYLAVYVDAVEWVELPNTIGMSQFADGGVMASKPYVASGKYIQRMSNYCAGCKYKPDEAVGESACPFTRLYWDFLMRHEEMLRKNPRMGMQVRNLDRVPAARKAEIGQQAEALREAIASRGNTR
ncbi:MAG: cryptochrome/photolyase family protein [Acidobacteria bacterium]|nr:cryptochrome/photolyase family protein [Acidobacteriota bacterium]